MGEGQNKTIAGFSKLSKQAKLDWLSETFFQHPAEVRDEFSSYWHSNDQLQAVMDRFSENTLTNFYIPYGIAPNFLINGREYAVPMVIEESSVVAAASSGAKFWLSRGGFKTEVVSTQKLGQLHFTWQGPPELMLQWFPSIKEKLVQETIHLTTNMQNRGGGILDISLRRIPSLGPYYYQILASFETCDSMGANFINSVMEQFDLTLEAFFRQTEGIPEGLRQVDVVMAILSNYTPDCLVKVSVECPVESLAEACQDLSPQAFAERFYLAVKIAREDPYRAVTHNKGIFNGVDAVILATANDFRAIEACGHAYASRDGQYRGLSDCAIENGIFRFWMDLPLAVGSTGGLTTLHPLAGRSLELLGNPTASQLMEIVAATGLAQNFSAVRSLVTTGIQKGHMKMHLANILNHFGVNDAVAKTAQKYFEDKIISFSAVREFLDNLAISL